MTNRHNLLDNHGNVDPNKLEAIMNEKQFKMAVNHKNMMTESLESATARDQTNTNYNGGFP